MTLSANAQGTVSNSAIQTHLQLTGARRADFVPAQPLDVDLQCLATATDDFHGFQDIHCSWPPAGSSDPPTLAISGAIPDIRNPRTATIEIGTPGLPAATLLDWLHIASSRVPADLTATGTLTGTLSYHPELSDATPWQGAMHDHQRQPHQSPRRSRLTRYRRRHPSSPSPLRRPGPTAQKTPATTTRLQPDSNSPPPLSLSAAKIPHSRRPLRHHRLHRSTSPAWPPSPGFTLSPQLFPHLGDGLDEVLPTNRAAGPFRIDLTATRTWGSAQTWTDNTAHVIALRPKHAH